MIDFEEHKVIKFFIIILAGIFIGAINGFFGGGGGMVCVPVLLLLGLVNQKAHATAILVMLPISIASGFVYYTSGVIEWDIALWIALGSVIGGALGALCLKKISNIALQYIFAIVVIAAGVRMLF
ncbi:MAG: sulfite exporter TauE/SafE family protein [Clostridia bacterium]|nr:sulfite exporter TauE/SafE family protein [Clostridia bacterium]